MVDWFEFSKTFAGPIATVFAAAAAVFFTWRLGKAQVRIAQSQRDIAFDKLKYDLFDKRYEIYQTAKAIIEPMLSESPMLSASPAVILSRTRSESGVRRDDPEFRKLWPGNMPASRRQGRAKGKAPARR